MKLLLLLLMAASFIAAAAGMSEKGYDTDVYEFNRANDIVDVAAAGSNSKGAVYYEPSPPIVKSKPEGYKDYKRRQPAQYEAAGMSKEGNDGYEFSRANDIIEVDAARSNIKSAIGESKPEGYEAGGISEEDHDNNNYKSTRGNDVVDVDATGSNSKSAVYYVPSPPIGGNKTEGHKEYERRQPIQYEAGGMSEEGYDNDGNDFNRANEVVDVTTASSNSKSAIYYEPSPPIGEIKQEGYEEYKRQPPGEYKYRWKVEDNYSGNYFGHAESRDDKRTVGEYYVMLPDGRVQRVKYSVEGPYGGFKAQVSYEGEAKIPTGSKKQHRTNKRPVRGNQPSYKRKNAFKSADLVPSYTVASTRRPSWSTAPFSHKEPTFVKHPLPPENESESNVYSYQTTSGSHHAQKKPVRGNQLSYERKNTFKVLDSVASYAAASTSRPSWSTARFSHQEPTFVKDPSPPEKESKSNVYSYQTISGNYHTPKKPVRGNQPSYERKNSFKATDLVGSYADASTPGPSWSTARFSHQEPNFVNDPLPPENDSESKVYSYQTTSHPSLFPTPESTAVKRSTTTPTPFPSLILSPNVYRSSMPPPPPPPSAQYYQQDMVRRYTYRPIEEEEEEAEEEKDDVTERPEDIDDDHKHLEVAKSFFVGPKSHLPQSLPWRILPPKERFRQSEVKALPPSAYAQSAQYPPLHHPYVLQDHLYPLSSVKRYTYRPIEEEKEEEEKDNINKIPEDDDTDNSLEVVTPFALGATIPSPQMRPLQVLPHKEQFRESEVKALPPSAYSLSSRHPPLHHPYVLQDHSEPLSSVKRYTYKEVSDDEVEAEKDADEDNDVDEESVVKSETEFEHEANTIADNFSDNVESPTPHQGKIKAANGDDPRFMFGDVEFPESDLWGYRYIP